jgi:hypothetical protein
MKPSIRLLKVLSAATWRGTRDAATRPSPDNPHAETVTRWRVMPGDLDLFGHMNNSRYLMLMDFGRLDYLARMGLLATAFRQRWIVPVGTAQVDFYRSLKPFERFEIATQVLSWNDRWFLHAPDVPDAPESTPNGRHCVREDHVPFGVRPRGAQQRGPHRTRSRLRGAGIARPSLAQVWSHRLCRD